MKLALALCIFRMSNISQLSSSLWKATEQLRATSKLNALEYNISVLGLIFLRYATNRYDAVRVEIEQTLPSRGGQRRALTSADFESEAAIFLPTVAHYDYLLALPEDKDLGYALDEAIRAIESESALLKGVLPKNYAALNKKTLYGLIRIFGQDKLRRSTDDVFESIYDYFLNQFAISRGREGEFYSTPSSLVETIVGVVEPTQGKVFDPACGGGGMLVQAGQYLKNLGVEPLNKVALHGQEISEIGTRLARMNLAMHQLDGSIYCGNTFYNSRFELMSECDYVLSNPPFNTDGVNAHKIRNDERLFTEKGMPRVSKHGTVSNANYLWIQYFYSYLKQGKGRAGFVMPSAATDAGRGEKMVREELIATGDIDIILSIGTNFLYATSIPCTLWFFDKGKSDSRKDNVLMIDAQEIYRVRNRRMRDFSPEQLDLILAAVWLYRGQTERFLALSQTYIDRTRQRSLVLRKSLSELEGVEEKFASALSIVSDLESNSSLSGQKSHQKIEELQSEFRKTVREMHVKRLDLLAFFNTNETLLEPLGYDADAKSHAKSYRRATQKLIDKIPITQRNIRAILVILKEIGRNTQRMRKASASEQKNGSPEDYAQLKRSQRTFREDKKTLVEALENALEIVRNFLDASQQMNTLNDYFPKDKFSNVSGFCRVVNRKEISDQDSSLTPKRYVGTIPTRPVENRMIGMLRDSNVRAWNQWRERYRVARPNLSGVDLRGLYLNKIDLSNAILNNAILDGISLEGSILQGIEGRSTSFKGATMKNADLRKSDLFAANFNEANLEGATLYEADLRDAQLMSTNLKKSNLSEARVLRTNFSDAKMTGACIADWQIGDTTQLDNVECAYIFRRLDLSDDKDGFQSRLPVDRNNTFKADEFSQRFQILQNASETIDLTFTEGVNWEALFSALQEVRAENVGKNIVMQRLEQKGSAFVVSLAVDPELDIERIDRRFNAYYDRILQSLESQNEYLRDANAQLQSDNSQLQTQLVELVVKTMAEKSQPQTINNNFQNPNIGNFSNTVQGDQTGGTINISGANMEDITRLLGSLRSHLQTLPTEKKEEALDAIERLETDINEPNPNPKKISLGLKEMVMSFVAVGVLTASTAAQVSSDIKDTHSNVSEVLEAIAEQVVPEPSSSTALPGAQLD